MSVGDGARPLPTASGKSSRPFFLGQKRGHEDQERSEGRLIPSRTVTTREGAVIFVAPLDAAGGIPVPLAIAQEN